MKTLTVTAARQNLGGWLKKAAAGEEIGVILGDKVIAFRPVPIVAGDYAETEYGLTSAEVAESAARIVGEVQSASVVDFKPGMFSHANPAHKALPRRRSKTKRR
jgi:antitoxin (DNA-binding transcriptional repressor) of toxin-antitoxin stability system